LVLPKGGGGQALLTLSAGTRQVVIMLELSGIGKRAHG
jgi:hypothetical protein